MKLLKKRFFVFTMIPLLLACLLIFGTDDKQEKLQPRQGMQFVTANPNPVDIEQPDGKILTLRLKGDEWLHLGLTPDGYTVLPNKKGAYFYARLDEKGNLVRSKFIAHNPEDRSQRERTKLSKIKKRLTFSKNQVKKAMYKRFDSTGDNARWGGVTGEFPTTGTRNMLIILGDFSDLSFIKTRTQFDDLFNTGSTSFKAYYQDNSYNLLTVNCTVVGPYTPNITAANADESCSTCIRNYISSLVDMAENAGLNFSQFDNNNDGEVDGLFVVHAGYGEEAGAPSWTIWSHAWTLSTYARTYDGVTIDRYATVPELRNASGSTMTAIGVCVHEFGHLLGAPDLYDTDGTGSGGSAWDCKYWDVMSGGSWNDNGDTPAQHNMYSKWKMGWSNPTVLSSAASVSLQNTSVSNTAYRIDTTTGNEFFILENRQLTGWDAALPGHGMLVFHIDGNYIDGLSGNTVNANPSHQGVDIEEADNLRTSGSYGGDPFPGTSNKTSFTDTTTPNSKSWANANTNKPVTAIAENSGLISFDFMGGSGSASITANFSFVTNDLSVDFTDTGTASGTTITNWNWNFGDGGSSTQQNPSHTYASAGTYTVTLTASDSGTTSDSTNKQVTVTSGGISYCTSSSTDYSYEWIAGVSVADLYNSSGAAGYSNFTSQTANLTAGASAGVSLTPGFNSSAYNEYWTIWIDYNSDGDFADAGEQVFQGYSNSTVSGSFTVASGVSGVTRMRVAMQYNSYRTDPCGSFTYGEVEDYTVDISGAVVYPPVANFTAGAATINVGQSVTFTDTSTNDPTSWSWSFESGTPSSSSSQNPTIQYNTAGTYNVTLTATNSAGSDSETKVDYITVNSAPANEIAEAVDNASLTFTHSGNADWNKVNDVYYYGGDSAESGNIGDNQASTIETSVTVGSTQSVKFYWKVSSEANYDYLRFYIDGVEQTAIAGTVDWTQVSYNIGAGTHTLKWSFIKDASVSSGSDCGWIDKVEIAAPSSDPIAEAVDYTSLSFSLTGNGDWYSQTATTYYGGDAAQSADIDNSQTTTMETTISGKTSVKFYWKVSSESNYDYLRFYIDGVEQTSISGTVNWTQKSYSVSSGSHTLKWSFTKDYSVSSGSDCGWVDKVELQ